MIVFTYYFYKKNMYDIERFREELTSVRFVPIFADKSYVFKKTISDEKNLQNYDHIILSKKNTFSEHMVVYEDSVIYYEDSTIRFDKLSNVQDDNVITKVIHDKIDKHRVDMLVKINKKIHMPCYGLFSEQFVNFLLEGKVYSEDLIMQMRVYTLLYKCENGLSYK